MNTNVFRLLLLGSLFSLSACVQQSEVRQMKHSVSTLNQEMTQLNKETVKITQQNRLNAKSSSGFTFCLEQKHQQDWKARSVLYVCRW